MDKEQIKNVILGLNIRHKVKDIPANILCRIDFEKVFSQSNEMSVNEIIRTNVERGKLYLFMLISGVVTVLVSIAYLEWLQVLWFFIASAVLWCFAVSYFERKSITNIVNWAWDESLNKEIERINNEKQN